MKMSYLAQELELGKRHEKILGLRTTLLQQMKGQCESQTNEKKLQVLKFESANERNALLLKDLEAAEETLKAGLHLQLDPTVIALEMPVFFHLYLKEGPETSVIYLYLRWTLQDQVVEVRGRISLLCFMYGSLHHDLKHMLQEGKEANT
ncbi:centrosomal protein 15 isoform X2 [Narcine bancroftii]|uniref:centrosomal protein 15 isoform X2 n=1 Tax=Narcine bancroftii TaxID=1343680 RepID=UPI00383155E5